MSGNGYWVGVTKGNQPWMMVAAGSNSTLRSTVASPLYTDFGNKADTPVMVDAESQRRQNEKLRKEWTAEKKQKEKEKCKRKKQKKKKIQKEAEMKVKLATEVASTSKHRDQKVSGIAKMPCYFEKKIDTRDVVKVDYKRKERKDRIAKEEMADEKKIKKAKEEKNRKKSERKKLKKQIRKEAEIKAKLAIELASILQAQKSAALPSERTEYDDGSCKYCGEDKEECTCLKIDTDYKCEEES